jgi:hypothetical protein
MNAKKWLKLAFLNLLVLAAIGIVLRCKILFYIPFIDQQRLLHGHSHFAFSGWVSLALMVLLLARVSNYKGLDLFKKYNWILWGNLVCAYGMLLSFFLQGYGAVSIGFSTGLVIISYFFGIFLWRDMNSCTTKPALFRWFKAAVVFNALSSIGAFALAFLMSQHTSNQTVSLASVYFFLHFQYNGWFSFSILGLLCEQLEVIGVSRKSLRVFFGGFLCACVPAYFLSALWMPIPRIVYVLVVLSAIIQVLAWAWVIAQLPGKLKILKERLGVLPYRLIVLALLAFSIKLLLQLGSTWPSLSTLAFGFRPVVIGYLHLVLLGFVSLFILGYALYSEALIITSVFRLGIFLFIAGIIGNEAALMIQGIMAMGYLAVPNIQVVLLCMACIIFSGALLIYRSAFRHA